MKCKISVYKSSVINWNCLEV